MKMNSFLNRSGFLLSGLIPRTLAALAASLTLGTLVTMTLVSLAYSPKAQACRDCPFPMRTSQNRWLMPNGQVEVSIVQRQIRHGKIETQIELHNAATGELLASGRVITAAGQSNVSTQLADPKGNAVSIEVVWYDEKHDRVQIDMHCMSDGCSIDKFADH